MYSQFMMHGQKNIKTDTDTDTLQYLIFIAVALGCNNG